MMLSNFGSYNRFFVKCMDGSLGLQELPDNSVKLVYGSPTKTQSYWRDIMPDKDFNTVTDRGAKEVLNK